MTDLAHEVWGEVLPGDVFTRKEQSEWNKRLLESDLERRRILSKKDLKRAKRLLYDLRLQLARFERDRWERRMKNADKALEAASADQRESLIQKAAALAAAEPPRVRGRGAIFSTSQAAKAEQKIAYIQKRIAEHQAAIENQRLYKELADEMQLEVKHFGDSIVELLAAMGIRHEFWRNGKQILRKLKIRRAWYTPDCDIFEIMTTSRTLFGAVRIHLPDNITVGKIASDENIRTLETALKRPVEFRGIDEKSGLFLVVWRVRMIDGLFETVPYKHVMEKWEPDFAKKFLLPVGVRSGREVVWVSLAEHPHLIVTGQSGSGKTNELRCWVAAAITNYLPSELQIAIVDLKRGGDFAAFADAPHIIASINQLEEFAEFVAKLQAFMVARAETLQRAKCVSIEEYNSRHTDKIPRLFCIIDEANAISLLDSQISKRVWLALSLIATQGRAAGITLVLGAQQAFSDSIGRLVNNNSTFMLSGRQRTLSGSLAGLGSGAAKKLPKIRGRMIVQDGTDPDGFQVQTPLIEHEDIAAAIAVAIKSPKPEDIFGALEEKEIKIRPIDVYEIARIAVSHGGGVNSRKIFDELKPSITLTKVEGLIALLKTMANIDVDGKTYTIEKSSKGGVKLVLYNNMHME